MGQQYTALRTIGTIYKVLGVIIGVLTLLIAFGIGNIGGFAASLRESFLGILLVLICGGGIALTLYATGEGVFLLIALEENTRMTAIALQRQIDTSARMQSSVQTGVVAQLAPILSSHPIGRGGQVQPRE
jgi:hypothetical protein